MSFFIALLALITPFNDQPIEAPPWAVSSPAFAQEPATRLDPPQIATDIGTPPVPAITDDSVGHRCVGIEAALTLLSPGWDVVRMSRLAYRESRCQPGAYNRRGQAAGLLQVTPITYSYLRSCLGEPVFAAKLFDAWFNIRAAACLWQANRYRPWAL